MKKRKTRSSDYAASADRSLYGGRTPDMPQPLEWYWPKGEAKRRISCSISHYGWSCPGASHYYASVEVEPNWVWNGEQWVKPWKQDADTPHTYAQREQRFSLRTESLAEAEDWINRELEKYSPDTHFVSGGLKVCSPTRLRYQEFKEGD